ncbi:MAG: GTP-dependent dephospho-CoA kinase family protein [Nitrososphaerota archaeon]|nr:GTP-dependent dephospho-CoA kinase family protein [Candidatus Bathyarchaeota archaeon]MDW8048235.1 GTP-dependent dephospho-CoA kinase family protein [Nitrososphaerota archaeon]
MTDELRAELKRPLGLLLKNSNTPAVEKLRDILEAKKPKKLIAVGDRVSRDLLKNGIRPDMVIIDYKIMREPVDPLDFQAEKTFHLENRAGTISEDSWKIIGDAARYNGTTKIVVEGEEDLLTLVAVSCSPSGSLVIYGQPREGIVVVEVTDSAKEKVKDIIRRMRQEVSKN